VKQFTAAGSQGADLSLRRGAAARLEGGRVVERIEAIVETMFSWGTLGWATVVLYGAFLV
jgi:hypothetical protein